MNMTLDTLISTYGYAAVAVGTFIEGETILLLAGFAAHQGYLKLPWVIGSAFLGTLFADQLFYYLGRYRGKHMLEKHPTWQLKSDKVFTLLEKYPILFIIGFRFLYGLRTIAPMLMGMSKISPPKFLILNMFGGAIWAISIGVLGYFFGHTLERILVDLKPYEFLVAVVFMGSGIGVWSYHFYKKNKFKNRAKDGEKTE
jgi:membrane protein DedA with SNARE-associated domain